MVNQPPEVPIRTKLREMQGAIDSLELNIRVLEKKLARHEQNLVDFKTRLEAALAVFS
jgi:predicted  nucleic acid-binding Zn-ribbon protein